MLAAGTLEEHLVPPPDPKTVRNWQIFGFTALGIGLTMVGLIIYAVIFSYR
jgi:hypothetical protein